MIKKYSFSKASNFQKFETIKENIRKEYMEVCYLDEELFEDAIEFYNEYFGYTTNKLNRDEAIVYAALGTRINADYWKSIKPFEKEDHHRWVDFFYETSPFHFFNNILRFMDGMHREIYLELEEKFKPPLLDFGGGTGGISIYFAKKGWDVSFVEIGLIYKAWMKWLNNKRNLGIKILDRPEGLYNFIIAKDVIEHVLEPQKLIDYLKSFLAADGQIHLSHYPCDGPNEMAPMHFKVSIKESEPASNETQLSDTLQE